MSEAADTGDTRTEALDTLASSLVWRIGRPSEDAPLTVRVGMASSVDAFREASKLHAASDDEIRAAMDAGDVRVEWIGPRFR
jgi:hypothetical protein